MMVLSESERQQLNAEVALAIEHLAPNWPIHTFNARSPLRALEDLPFDQALRRGQEILGGRGYLSNDEYRRLYAGGRITRDGLRAALARLRPDLLSDPPVTVGTRRIEPSDVLLLHLVQGINAATPAGLRWAIVHEQAATCARPDVPREVHARLVARGQSNGETGKAAAAYVISALWTSVLNVLDIPDTLPRNWPEGAEGAPQEGAGSPGEADRTVGEWVRDLAGIDLVEQVNDQMIKWCAAFLDEGLARWPMPSRELGFYRAWRDLAPRDRWGWFQGIRRLGQSIRELPEQPEDAIAASLQGLQIPVECRTAYLTRHVAQLPGWAGLVHWRSSNADYPWQRRYPIHPVEYLAVRMFYEAELAQAVGRTQWGTEVSLPMLLEQARRRKQDPHDDHDVERLCREAWRLFHLAQFLDVSADEVRSLAHEACARVLGWLDRFPPDAHGPVWLEAYEEHYRQALFSQLNSSIPVAEQGRPRAQAVFCIDVRSEPLRRHLEKQGPYETLGFAGFFMLPICFQPFDSARTAQLCPVLLKPKHQAQESPCSEQDPALQGYLTGSRWRELTQHLLHDLKSSPLASYLLTDVVGCVFGAALLGKTVARSSYARFRDWVRSHLVPTVSTTIRVEKFSKKEVEETLAVQERMLVSQALHHRLGRRAASSLAPAVIEELRVSALEGRPIRDQGTLGLSPAECHALLDELRTEHGLNQHERAIRLERLTVYGFTTNEQVQFVEAALRAMGLVRNFARLVLFCGHRSTTENNPYSAGLDCGACGGNPGGPNARVLAAMANSGKVRGILADRGIAIPDDTWFIAGRHDTTTDHVELLDGMEIPETHQREAAQLIDDLQRAGLLVTQERCSRLPGAPHRPSRDRASRHIRRRSADWSQVRPEWGLSGNAAFIVGRRALTRGLNLQGRVFLHSYDHEQDPTGRFLEIIMSAPGVLVEWFSMQYYCSAVDPWVYGSGTKVLHNVVGGVGVMLGSQSDLQTGFPLQTVMDVTGPFHEPMRLSVIIEAPPAQILGIIQRQPVLQRIYNNRWVHLTAREPRAGLWHRYQPGGQWEQMVA